MRRLIQVWGSKPGSIFEAVALVAITLLLVGFYLYSAGSVTRVWLIVCTTLAIVGVVGSLMASYYQVAETQRREEHTEYRINYQLIETLKTKEALPDVIFGLEGLIRWKTEHVFKGQAEFLEELEQVFGSERLKEVEATLLKYARAPISHDSDIQSTGNGGPPLTPPKELPVAKGTDNGAQAPATITAHG
jgi:hypothetical protein